MPLRHAARSLWSRASAWRYAVIVAGVMTALGLVSMVTGGGGSAGMATRGSAGNTPGGQTCPAGQQFDPATGLCVPAGQPGVAGNCAPSGARPQTVPGNVVMVTQQGSSPATLARITAFESQADAANAEQRQGERCALLASALDELEPADLATIRCEPAALKKYGQAIQCRGDILASNRRLGNLVAAFDAYGTDRSAVVVRRLARTWEALTPFDQSRERYNALADAVLAGETAATRITDSDARIAALESAAKFCRRRRAGEWPRNGCLRPSGASDHRLRRRSDERDPNPYAGGGGGPRLNESRSRMRVWVPSARLWPLPGPRTAPSSASR